jgi:hypothetical protein
MTIKTTLEWGFEPTEFFEASTPPFALPGGELVVEAGKAVYTLSTPLDPVPHAVRDAATQHVKAVFAAREMLIGRTFELNGPHVAQYLAGGIRNITIHPLGVSAMAMVGSVDFVVRDATGKVARDTKAERIATESQWVADVAPKLLQSPILARMVESYNKSSRDPANALVYLYEILETAVKHYGGKTAAIKTLGVSAADWSELGRLANYEPLHEGRHRGATLSGLRHTTPEELNRAMSVALSIIEGLARQL